MAGPLISLRGLYRRFDTGGDSVTVLDDVNLDIEAGEMIAIVGQSGSGKSTLMNILGCLDKASAGAYTFAGRDISKLGPDELAELRRERFEPVPAPCEHGDLRSRRREPAGDRPAEHAGRTRDDGDAAVEPEVESTHSGETIQSRL